MEILIFQIGDYACEGSAAFWASWYWQNTYCSSNWKNVEWEGTEGLEMVYILFHIYIFTF
jgi:hypothetical protein